MVSISRRGLSSVLRPTRGRRRRNAYKKRAGIVRVSACGSAPRRPDITPPALPLDRGGRRRDGRLPVADDTLSAACHFVTRACSHRRARADSARL